MKMFSKVRISVVALALGLCSPAVGWAMSSMDSSSEEAIASEPAGSAGSERQWLEVKIEPGSEGLALTWFAPEGAACQMQTSTDLTNWTDVGPIIGGTNGWVSMGCD